MATEKSFAYTIERRPEFADILREDYHYATGDNLDSISNSINGWFDRLMIQAGIEILPVTMLLLCLLSSILAGGLVSVIQADYLITAVAVGLGGLIPIGYSIMSRHRRQKEIRQQLPAVIEKYSRLCQSGRSLEDCFARIVCDTRAPLGDELIRCSRKARLGIPLVETLRDLPARTGLNSLSDFVAELSLQQATRDDGIGSQQEEPITRFFTTVDNVSGQLNR